MSQLLDNLEFKKNKKTSICLSFCFFGFFSNFRFDLGRKFAVVDLNSFVGSFFVVNKLFYQTNESDIQCRRVLDACIDPTLAIFAKDLKMTFFTNKERRGHNSQKRSFDIPYIIIHTINRSCTINEDSRFFTILRWCMLIHPM